MARHALASLALAVILLLPGAMPARAADPEAVPGPRQLAHQYVQGRQATEQALADEAALARLPEPAAAFDRLRRQVRIADTQYRQREGIRSEQVVIYEMAADPGLEREVTPLLPSAASSGLAETVAGLRSLWRSAGVTDFSQIRLRRSRRFADSEPVDKLLGYYRSAAGTYPVDWSYLASINFIESDFGRINGPSSAGAMGPMQFMPGTWREYGEGDIQSPRDSIQAAARYLNRMGAPANYDRAIYRYNNDRDYVAAVEHFAAALRTDPAWLTRLYYWSTQG